LNLLFYEFYFEARDGKELYLSIWLLSDTGYFLSEEPGVDKRTVKSFAPVEVSSTKVGLVLYKNWRDDYGKIYNAQVALRRFIEKDGELPDDLKKGGVVAKCCDFSRLRDEISTDSVITELIELARTAGLPLKRVKKSA
jgi:hypothetical protein